ncbi:MAG: neutral zinc metallopeptidase [Ilumatobacteraceae bacterium]
MKRLTAALIGFLAACGGADLTLVDSRDIDDATSVRFGSWSDATDYTEFLDAAITDIEDFWSSEYPLLYGDDYPPLLGGVHGHRQDRRTELPTGCSFNGDYADVEENAFYCDEGDFIVFDDEILFPSFADEFGVVVVGVIMAHEWGHVIQSPLRNDILDSRINTTLELQADCFAGAWTARVRRDGVGGRSVTDRDITASLLGLVQLGDRPGDRADDPAAHGSAFDRVSAFQEGFLGGVGPCADYENEAPVPLQFGFTVEELSRPNPSDFPFDAEMFELLTGDLDLYWSAVLPSWSTPTVSIDGDPPCGDRRPATLGVEICVSPLTIVVDPDLMLDVYSSTPGDFAVGYLLAVGYGELVQVALDLELDGEIGHLLNDCLAGAWSGDILPLNDEPVVPPSEDNPRISLSPGDLDEAIRTIISIGDVSADIDEYGSPFEKVDAFRQGVFNGVAACLG